MGQMDLDGLVKQVHQLAPLPAVALKVLELAQDERSSASDLASVIATDQAMTAKLLRLSNSAYFSAGREIVTVRDAIVVLGVMEIRRLVLTTALMGNFAGAESGTFSVASFWGHGLAVAMIAEVMARHSQLAPPDEAFTAGILHDIGKLVMNQYLHDEFEAAASTATAKGIPLERAEDEVFGFSHPELGKRLAEVWRLPQALCDAIGSHHGVLNESHGLSYVVAQANTMCRDHGLWCGFDDIEPGATLPDTHVDDPLRAAVLQRLGGWDKVLERTGAFLDQAGPSRRRPSAAVNAGPEPSAPPSPPTAQPAPSREAAAPARTSLRTAFGMSADRFPSRFGRR